MTDNRFTGFTVGCCAVAFACAIAILAYKSSNIDSHAGCVSQFNVQTDMARQAHDLAAARGRINADLRIQLKKQTNSNAECVIELADCVVGSAK